MKAYYIDRSVLLENTPLVKFIRNYIREPSGIFSIGAGTRDEHLKDVCGEDYKMRILMSSFPALSRLLVQTVSEKWRAIDLFIYKKRKSHGGLKI